MDSLTHVPGFAAPWRLLEGYQPRGVVHDELFADDGQPRPHYDTFVRSLETLGRHELASRWENAKRAIRDNGVTYNVYGDPEGTDCPWTLDMIPLLVTSSEWSRLEAALVQRARVLNLLLADLYGPQRLVREQQLAGAARVRQPGVPSRVPRHRGAARHPSPLACGGPRPGAGRAMVGAGRPHAGAVGRRLHARESNCPVSKPARGVSRLPGAAPGLVLLGAARYAGGAFHCASRHAAGRPAHAGAAQRDLLRARLPGALPRVHARRGWRSDSPGSPRVHQDARRSAAGRRDLQAARRQLLRSAGAALRFHTRCGRTRRSCARGQRDDRQCARLRGHRDCGAVQIPARALSQPAGRGASAAIGADALVRRARRSAIRAGAPRSHGHQAHFSAARRTADLRAHAQRPAASARSSPTSGRTRIASSGRTRCLCRRLLCGSGRSWSRVRSCCACTSPRRGTPTPSCLVV